MTFEPTEFFDRLQVALVADPGWHVGRDGVLQVETYAGPWHVVMVAHFLRDDPPLYIRPGGWHGGADWTLHVEGVAAWAAAQDPAALDGLVAAGSVWTDDAGSQDAILELWRGLCVRVGGL